MNRVTQFAREAAAVARVMSPATAALWYLTIIRQFANVARQRNLKPADCAMSRYPWLRTRAFGRDMLIPGECFGLAREMYGRLVYFLPSQFEIKPDDVVVD